VQLAQWLAKHDRNYVALRRGGRAAIVLPALFVFASAVLHNPVVATYSAYGSFAMLLLVDFSGTMRQRLEAQTALVVLGAVLVVLGTLATVNPWLAAIVMTIVGFAILFAGALSSVLASASFSLLLAFIIAVSSTGPMSSVWERVEGWGIAGIASLAAIALLWPAPTHDRLREGASAACRALAARLRAEIAFELDRDNEAFALDRDRELERANGAVRALSELFLATPYRPAALSTSARAVLRLVEEIGWIGSIVETPGPITKSTDDARAPCAVKATAAAVLERGADVLDQLGAEARELHAAIAELSESLARLEQRATTELGARLAHRVETSGANGESASEFITALDPTFRAQELGFATLLVARSIDLSAAAERRGWLQRVLGKQPAGISSTLSAVQGRATAHVKRHSVWLHNSVRGAIGLGLAVLAAHLTGAERSFWVIFAVLSVLRSSALHTGQNAVRALVGTALGFIVCAALLVVIGTNTTVLWILLPFAVFLAGVAPAAISFTAGQAAFTLVVVILFNIIQPAGWRVGLVRIEDIALGSAVSIAVGLLFWPRGARAALRDALSDAYEESAAYLAAAVDFGMGRCDLAGGASAAPSDFAIRAGAAERRLDDTFRNYLAERGAKPYGLADITPLIAGVGALRLAGDAVADLWRSDDCAAPGDRGAARREIADTTRRLEEWYDDLAASLIGRRALPDPLPRDDATEMRLLDALRTDLRGGDGHATATAVRVLWTGDHLDRVRRLEGAIIEPARVGVERGAA
jgi:uncharacterized membrane protein YccC